MEIEFYQSKAIENSQMEHLRSCCFSCARVPFIDFQSQFVETVGMTFSLWVEVSV